MNVPQSPEVAVEIGKFEHRRLSDVPPAKAYQSDHQHAHEPLRISWSDLSFGVKKGRNKGTRRLLHNVGGSVAPGELAAIMGPSGAGKSTLLNVLAGRAPYGELSGTIRINGEDPSVYRRKLAYVMQEDALYPTQTPREMLNFTAALRLAHLSASERDDLVESLIATLGLTKCADTMIGSLMIKGLSGGEKKRTAVAVELISSPSLIFLDEPTSGLDSHSAYEVIKHMKALAAAGSTIICTIHQPSSEVFDLFTKVMLLREGAVVYDGPIDGVVPHFANAGYQCKANYNPADFAMQKLQTLTDEELQPLIQAVPEKFDLGLEQFEEPAEKDFPQRSASFFTQLVHLTKREVMQFVRDRPTLGARYGMAVILAVMTGLYFLRNGNRWGDDGQLDDITKSINNHWGAVVFSSINAMFLSAQPMLLAFPAERPVFMREYTSGAYGTLPYFLCKTLIEAPAALIQTMLQLVIVYFMVDMQGNFVFMTLSNTLLGLVTSSVALVLGAATTRPETAVNVMPAVYVPQILSSGYFVSTDAVPIGIRWTQWICPLKYGIALSTVSEFSREYVPDDREAQTVFLLASTDIVLEDWWIYVVIMLGIFLFFRVVSALILARRAKNFS
ncbi:ABC transporter G family member 7 [Diplonema papillatum]|nr:ABC transporter G family member 7 [Diplonema papillatum]